MIKLLIISISWVLSFILKEWKQFGLFQREKLLNRKENYMSQKNFADMSIEERQKILFEMSDKDIDFTDIPEINEDFLKTVKKNRTSSKIKDRYH